MRRRSWRAAKGEWGFRRHRRLTTRGKKGKTSANVGRRLGGKEEPRLDPRARRRLAGMKERLLTPFSSRCLRIRCLRVKATATREFLAAFSSRETFATEHTCSLALSFSLSTINRAVGSLSCQFFLRRQRLIKHWHYDIISGGL